MVAFNCLLCSTGKVNQVVTVISKINTYCSCYGSAMDNWYSGILSWTRLTFDPSKVKIGL